jgi:hypothetical protein
MSCNGEALMAVRERRKRKIRERKEKYLKIKKGINRERKDNVKGVPQNITKITSEIHRDIIFLSLLSCLDYGITNKIIGDY